MSQIPQNQVTQKDLADWFTQKVQLAKLRVSEMLLRKKIFNGYFPTPKEGANNHTLPDNYILKATHVVDRKIDEPMLVALWDDLVAEGINMNALIVKKPELVMKAYRELTEEQRKKFDQVLIIKDGSPSLEIVPPSTKKKAGEKAGEKAAK